MCGLCFLLDYGGGGLTVLVGDDRECIFHQIFMKRESDIISLPSQAPCCLICMGGGVTADTVSDQS